MEWAQTVYVVDDDRDLVWALERLIRSSGLDTANFRHEKEFLDCVPPDRPGCLLYDVPRPGLDGLAVQRRLAEHKYTIPLIVCSSFAEVKTAVHAIRDGALDFMLKPVSVERILSRIREALDIDLAMRRSLLAAQRARARHALLTNREREVLALVTAGWPTKDISRWLKISPKTVEIHRSRIMEKMEAESLPELIRLLFAMDDPVMHPADHRRNGSNGGPVLRLVSQPAYFPRRAAL